MKAGKLINLINILILCFIILWEAFQRTLLAGIDGRSRVIIILCLVLFVNNFLKNRRYKKTLYSKKSVFKFWLFWFIYATINTLFKYSKEIPIDSFIGYNLFMPFVMMSTVASLQIKYLDYLLRWLGLSVYISFIIYFATSNFQGGRFNVANFDPNEFSLMIYLLLILIGLSYLKNKITRIQFVFLLGLPVYFAVMLGSRMGFIGTMILVLAPFLTSIKKNRLISYRKFFIIIGLSVIPIFYIINNTFVGKRLMNTTESYKESKINYAEGTVFEKFGDRGVYYVRGWDAFIDEPITGIGLKNFLHNYWPTVLHSEFMVQLAELGLIGFILYLLFNISVVRSIREAKKTNASALIYNYLFFVFSAIMISASVLFMYHSMATAIIYGLILLLTNSKTTKRIIRIKIK